MAAWVSGMDHLKENGVFERTDFIRCKGLTSNRPRGAMNGRGGTSEMAEWPAPSRECCRQSRYGRPQKAAAQRLPAAVPLCLRRSRLVQFFEYRDGRRCRRLAHDQLRFYGDDLRKLGAADSLQQCLGGEFAHAPQGLADRRQARILKRSALDVVEADYGNLARHFHPGIEQSADRANRRDVVKSKHRGEVAMLRQQGLGDVVPGLRRWCIGLELGYQIGIDR